MDEVWQTNALTLKALLVPLFVSDLTCYLFCPILVFVLCLLLYPSSREGNEPEKCIRESKCVIII